MAGTVLLDTTAKQEYAAQGTAASTIVLTTNGVNRFAVLFIQNGSALAVSTVVGGGTWTRRVNSTAGIELWTCPLATTQTTVTVTVTLSGTSAQVSLILDTYYVSGAASIPTLDQATNNPFIGQATPTGTFTTTLLNTTAMGYIFSNSAGGGFVVAVGSYTLNTSNSTPGVVHASELANVDIVGIGASPSVGFQLQNAGTGSIIALNLQGVPPALAPPTGVTATYVPGLNGNPGTIRVDWTALANGYVGTGYNVYRVSSSGSLLVAQARKENNPQPFNQIPWGTVTFTDRALAYPPKRSGENIYTYYVTTFNNAITPAVESALSTGSSPCTFLG